MPVVLKAPQEHLLSTLQSVAGIVERRHTLPILANVLLQKQGTMLRLTTSDLEVQIQTSAEMGGDASDFRTTVAVRKLVDILRTMPAGQVVTLESNQSKLVLKGGKSRFTLQTLPAEDFPLTHEQGAMGPAFSVPQKTLKSLIEQVAFAMAVNDVRYYLNGMLFVAEGSKLTLVATDGHRLAHATATLDHEVPRQEVILPRKTVLELRRLLTEGDGQIEMRFAANQARFSFGGMEFTTKLVEGKFPDFNRVIPTKNENRLELGRAQFLVALQRIAIMTSEKFKGVTLSVAPGVLRLSSNNQDQEEAVDELEVDYNGDEIQIGFNVTYLTEVLQNMEVDGVLLRLKDGDSSALITPVDREDFKYVVMPMRI